jgi:hypothetical protein
MSPHYRKQIVRDQRYLAVHDSSQRSGRLGARLPGEPGEAQFGPHRFYAGEGGGSEQFRGARLDAADLRGARFTDCDLTAQPGYAEILAARADRMAVLRRFVAGLTDDSLGRLCQRSPAPGYPDEERTVIDCIAVVMDEEIEHYRFAVRDLAVLEAS